MVPTLPGATAHFTAENQGTCPSSARQPPETHQQQIAWPPEKRNGGHSEIKAIAFAREPLKLTARQQIQVGIVGKKIHAEVTQQPAEASLGQPMYEGQQRVELHW